MGRFWIAGSAVFVATAIVSACSSDPETVAPVDGGIDGTTDSNVNGDTSNKADTSATDTGVTPDGAADSAADASSDAGGATTLVCGNQSCSLPSESCCVNLTGPTLTCTGGDGSTCAQGNVALKCAKALDCPNNDVCCLDATVDPALGACSATCTGADHITLCDPNGSAQANKCGDAGACGNANIATWGLTKAYGTCGDPMGPL